MADYFRCYSTSPPDCFDGSAKIGPFEHYSGTPNYTGYTIWVEENTQYVKASYTAVINEYPEKVEYNLNNSSWNEITDNLGSGTTSTTIPASPFSQGINALQFRESNGYSTRFEWTLYMNQGSTPQTYVSSYACDSFGNVISATDSESQTKNYAYSSSNQYAYLTSVTDALGNTTDVSYEFSTGRILSMTDPKGNCVRYEYDLLGRVTKKINPDSSEREVVYDDLTNSATIYDELDHYVRNYYDGLNRLKTLEWYRDGVLYATESYTYNYLNKLVTKTDPAGNPYHYEYDSGGRTTKAINPDGTFSLLEYDDIHSHVRITDENGHLKEYQYDWAQRLIAVKEYYTAENYFLTQYEYDQIDNVVKQIDAMGRISTVKYDSLFGPTLVTYPDGSTLSFTYDNVGNVVSRTKGNETTSFLYDDAYRKVQIYYPDLSTVQFTYDENGNRVSMVNDYSTVTYLYDSRGRMSSRTVLIDGNEYTFYYACDVAGRMTSITYPDLTVITRSYDDLNRLTSIEGYAQFTYTVDSLLEAMTSDNGVVTTFSYDHRHRPLSITAEKGGIYLLHLEYNYDPVGNIYQMTNSWLGPDMQQHTSVGSFAYDALDRLTSASNGYGTISFGYDAAGNRVSMDSLLYTYNDMDELLSIEEAGGDTDYTFTYDVNGNTLSKASDTDEWLYQYDGANRLTEVQHNSQVVGAYVYDGNGQRIKKTEWNPDSEEYETIIYLYSFGDVCYERNMTTGIDAIYIYGPDDKLAKRVGEEIMYYHSDHLGSTRLLTDEGGNPVTAIGIILLVVWKI
ncbi:MAG: hypothetical protein WBA22_03630 [Candidatus Methanofastidiosia archaeon]